MERTREHAWDSSSARRTARIGESIGRRIDHGMCISLVGPLGAGKTVLAGGVCRGLGVGEEILSPTFVLYEEFEGRLPVAHVDLYRVEHESEIEELGVFGRLGGAGVILVEWGDRSESLLARSDAVVHVLPGEGVRRRIVVRCTPEADDVFAGVER